MLTTTTLAAFLALVALFIHHRRTRNKTPPANNARKWLQQQRCIIDFTYAGPRTTLKERLHLRAQANRRLVAAFEINNSLTTSSVTTHEQFRKAVRGMLSKDTKDWEMLYRAAQVCLAGHITEATATPQRRASQFESFQYHSKHHGPTSIPLARTVRHVCLPVVLESIFGQGGWSVVNDKSDEESVTVITEEINKLWVQSKQQKDKRDEEAAAVAESKQRLSSALRNLSLELPTTNLNANKNEPPISMVEVSPETALEFILPQYETLWRVVLLTYVTAYHRQPGLDVAKRLEDVPACLGDRERERRALMVAKEGLRLYPSNKRIYRAAAASSPTADDKQQHNNNNNNNNNNNPSSPPTWKPATRDPRIWGPDALEFRPERFENDNGRDGLSELQKEAYLPYSIGTHKCPAFAGFGDRMVTMLVAVFGKLLPAGSTVVRFNDEELDGDLAKALPTGREDMEGWVVEWAR